ncbi:TPA: PTPRF interacting protein alpha 1-like [Bos taurus]|nr:TPA: PTPRF interacting protein alpha 1-like [Bos taurus]
MAPQRVQGTASIARLHQDRVVARGADAVLGRQVEERHHNIKERLRQMEAQLEEKNKELLWVQPLKDQDREHGRQASVLATWPRRSRVTRARLTARATGHPLQLGRSAVAQRAGDAETLAVMIRSSWTRSTKRSG